MKALTISQPFASLIARLWKWIENRSWPTNYRGRLAIHAGKGSQYLEKSELLKYDTGCIVAVADLVACVSVREVCIKAGSSEADSLIPGTSVTWRQAVEHEHCEGPWCWILANVVKLDNPIPCTGAQGLWNLPEDVEKLLT